MSLNDACEAMAAIVAEYRQGEIAPMDAAHVRRWVDQFAKGTRESIAVEMAHILSKSYWSRQKVTDFITKLVTHPKLGGDAPGGYRKATAILHLQRAGNSQRDFLAIFDRALRARTGLSIADCGGADAKRFFYLDDALFSGGRIKSGLIRWIGEDAPSKAEVIVALTGDRAIVENSRKDDFWGAKPAGDRLEGRNVLGRLLMDLRERVREQPATLLAVRPLPIADFMLLEEPIRAVDNGNGGRRQDIAGESQAAFHLTLLPRHAID